MSNRLTWEIRQLRFTDDFENTVLSSRGIFEISNDLLPSSGITSSSIVVLGDIANNGSNICCLTFVEKVAMNKKSCTIIKIYGERIIHNFFMLHCQHN